MSENSTKWYRPSDVTREEGSSYALLDNLPPPNLYKTRRQRDEAGQNIWTGEQLSGEEAQHWIRNWVGLPEKFPSDGSEKWGETVCKILSANKNTATVLKVDGTRLGIQRTVTSEKEVFGGKQRKRKRIEFQVFAV